MIALNYTMKYTSSNAFCDACHVHPHVTQSWRQSTHYVTKSGMQIGCVDCHLPPEGVRYYSEKAKTGLRDALAMVFKDTQKINWDEKSRLEHAVKYMYKDACLHCHQNLFPLSLSKKGDDAHIYYTQHADKMECLNCHLHVGHYSKEAEKQDFGKQVVPDTIYLEPAKVETFDNFTEFIPLSNVKFDMIAIPGGTFTIGSPEQEPYRNPDEGPQRTVEVSPFWMAKTEVTWAEYEAFYRQTAKEGRTDTRIVQLGLSDVDGITGPTPPYGSPDQGWGKGPRPAITMTFQAAMVYCKWLSQVTGKKYRLPTEAEWEYACRANSQTPYFFPGDPKKFSKKHWLNSITGVDTSRINSFVVYQMNSQARTQPPDGIQANPFGLVNMLGNVREFCQDWYSPNTYSTFPTDAPIRDPRGPDEGLEHVVRGGSFKSDPADLRSATRDRTRTEAWFFTDPQMPKSIWWYSDVTDVGFRVVCEFQSP